MGAVVGCAGGGKGDVSGQVKFNGQPLPAGAISFISQVGDKQVVNATIQDGKYTVKDIAAGPVLITVATYPPSPPPQLAPGVKPIEGPKGETSAASPPGKYVKIPQKYSLADQSGLTYTVTKGSQEHNIELTP